MDIQFLNTPDTNNPFLIIYKPSGLPSAPITEDDKENALYKAIIKYPKIKNVEGRKKIEFGLLHRLDTVTEGLLLIALSQDFYDSIIALQEEGNFIKTYSAVCNIKPCIKEGFPKYNNKIKLTEGYSFIIESLFRGFGKGQKEVRPVTNLESKYISKKTNINSYYFTQVRIITVKSDTCEVECKIKKGYRHQVRCHLAWVGLPIVNDSLYNEISNKQIMFIAVGLDFSYKGKSFSFRKD